MLQNANLPLNKRKELVSKLNVEYKDYLKNQISEKDNYAALEANQRASNNAMIQKIRLTAQQEILAKEMKKATDAEAKRWDLQKVYEEAKEGKVNTFDQIVATGSEYAKALVNPTNVGKLKKSFSDPQAYFRAELAKSIIESEKASKDFEAFQKRMGAGFGQALSNPYEDAVKTSSTNPAAPSDLKTSNGIGTAKVINITIGKMMEINAQKIEGSDQEDYATKTVELLIREIKNINYAQGVM
jgi:hypothetical protein